MFRKSLHHLPDAPCQQLKALIDLRLPSCSVIKEQSFSVSFFLLILPFIYLVLAWTQLGAMCRWFGALRECLVHSQEFIFLPACPFHFMARAERWPHGGKPLTTARHREVQHVTDKTNTGEGRGKRELEIRFLRKDKSCQNKQNAQQVFF